MKKNIVAVEQMGLFDYGALDASTREFVQDRTERIKTLVKRSGQDIIDIGQSLIEVKERLDHGQFLAWLEAEFHWSERTARNLMAVAERFKSAKFADLEIAPSALYALAAPSTPDEAVIEVLDRAAAGESISHALARSIIHTAKKLRLLLRGAQTAAHTLPVSPVGADRSPTLIIGRAETLEGIDDETIDVIITSPPYNLGDEEWPMGGQGRTPRNGIGYATHLDDMMPSDYEDWQIAVLRACWRVAKPGASFFYNHKPRTLDGELSHPVRWLLRKDNPWTVRQEIIWDRGSTHNHSAQLFWQVDERIYWLTKGRPTLPDRSIGMSTIWKVFGPVPGTWHPAPFSAELPRLCLKAITDRPVVVLDPFAGSCKTLAVALEMGHEAVGVDVVGEYLANAAKEHGWNYGQVDEGIAGVAHA